MKNANKQVTVYDRYSSDRSLTQFGRGILTSLSLKYHTDYSSHGWFPLTVVVKWGSKKDERAASYAERSFLNRVLLHCVEMCKQQKQVTEVGKRFPYA